MFSAISNMFKKDPIDLTLFEYYKIKKLYSKLDALAVTDDIQKEMKDTQLQILLNNFEDIAKIFEIKNEKHYEDRDGLLNLQSTSKRVLKFTGLTQMDYFSEKIKKNYPIEFEVIGALPRHVDFSLEKKFLSLDNGLKPKAIRKIKKRVKEKVKIACSKLVKRTPLNENAFFEFIMNNFDKDAIFDINAIEERYTFAEYLINNFKWDDSFEVDTKKVLLFTYYAELAEKLKTRRYDFLIRNK